MEHNRKQKLLMIIALVIGIASLSIGFAAFSVSLNISSQASVSPSSDTFKVKFSTSKDSLVVGSVTPSSNTSNLVTTNGIINNNSNPTITNLSATFTKSGQYVEYTVYARNEGEYTAYLNSVNFIGEKTCEAVDDASESLVSAACDSINVVVIIGDKLYMGTEGISGHQLPRKTGEKITIRLEYASTRTEVDGALNITFNDIMLVYSTINDSSFKPVIPSEKVVKLESGDLNTPGSIVSIGEEQFYVFGQDDGNVKLLAMYNLYVGYSVDEDWNLTPLTHPTGIQDSSARGHILTLYGGETFPFIGTINYASEERDDTNCSEYSGSIVEGYILNYENYLSTLGVKNIKSRLITEEELHELGCGGFLCTDAPSWLYSTTYWLYTPPGEGDVLFLRTDSYLGSDDCEIQGFYGIRPVIEIPLSEFE